MYHPPFGEHDSWVSPLFPDETVPGMVGALEMQGVNLSQVGLVVRMCWQSNAYLPR